MAKRNKMIETSAAALAPETGSEGQAQDTTVTNPEREDSEPAKRAVAKHELINRDGGVVDNEEEASGIRYTLLANNATFEWIIPQDVSLQPGTPAAMLAIFGAKTLCTNESSAARNNTKGAASADDQMAAIRERFEILASGKWVDRSREGVGAKVDLDALAEAICRVLVAEDKKSQADVDSGYKATVRQKLDDDKTYARKTRAYPPVAVQYAAIVGRATSSVDDLMA